MSALSSFSSELTLEHILIMARRRRFLTYSVIALSVCAILLLFFILPSVNSILESRREIVTKEEELASVLETVNKLSTLDRQEIQASIKILETTLPPEKPVVPLLYSLDRLATQAQVSIADFEVNPGSLSTNSADIDLESKQESPLAPNVYSLPLEVDVSGTFENMNNFFRLLDNVIPLMRVASITFGGSDSTTKVASESGMFQAQVKLESLYTIPKTTQVVDAKTLTVLTPEDRKALDTLSAAYQTYLVDLSNQTAGTGGTTSTGRTDLFTQ